MSLRSRSAHHLGLLGLALAAASCKPSPPKTALPADLPPPEYEPSRSLDLTPKAAPPAEPPPAAAPTAAPTAAPGPAPTPPPGAPAPPKG